MRVGPQPIIARPAWYDRNAASRADTYTGQQLAPHALTTRLTYTVPAGKKAIVELLQVKCVRRTAATTVGLVYAYATITPSGGSEKEILDSYLFGNAVGDKDGQALQGTLVLCTGDVINMKTYDGSTGGTVDYFLAYKVTEFDA